MDKVEKRVESFLESDSILFILVIGFTTLFSFAIVTAGLLNGITTLLPHLFYIPVVFAAYRYPREGMILSVLVSSLYLVLVPLIIGPVPDVVINAYGHSVVIVAVGVIVSVLSFQFSYCWFISFFRFSFRVPGSGFWVLSVGCWLLAHNS